MKLDCIAIAPCSEENERQKQIQRALFAIVVDLGLVSNYEHIQPHYFDLVITIPDEQLGPFLTAVQTKRILNPDEWIRVDCCTDSQATLCRIYGNIEAEATLSYEEEDHPFPFRWSQVDEVAHFQGGLRKGFILEPENRERLMLALWENGIAEEQCCKLVLQAVQREFEAEIPLHRAEMASSES